MWRSPVTCQEEPGQNIDKLLSSWIDVDQLAACQVGQLEDLVWGLSLFKCAFLCLSSVMLLHCFLSVCSLFLMRRGFAWNWS